MAVAAAETPSLEQTPTDRFGGCIAVAVGVLFTLVGGVFFVGAALALAGVIQVQMNGPGWVFLVVGAVPLAIGIGLTRFGWLNLTRPRPPQVPGPADPATAAAAKAVAPLVVGFLVTGALSFAGVILAQFVFNAPGWVVPLVFFAPPVVFVVLMRSAFRDLAARIARATPSPESQATAPVATPTAAFVPDTSKPVPMDGDWPTVPVITTTPGRVLAHALSRAEPDRGCAFRCAVFLALFWNGIVSVFAAPVARQLLAGNVPRNWQTLFLIPFVLVGLGLFAWAAVAGFRWFVSLLVGRVEVEVSAHPLAPGRGYQVHAARRGAFRPPRGRGVGGLRDPRRRAGRRRECRAVRPLAHVREGDRGPRRDPLPGVAGRRRHAGRDAEPGDVLGEAAADAVDLRRRADQGPLGRPGPGPLREDRRGGAGGLVRPVAGGSPVIRVGRPPRVNPFSTRFVEPGAIPFRLPDGRTPADLARRLEASGGWGEIVGPHGSGKSTLLAALLPVLAGWTVRHARLSSDRRTLPDWVWEAFPARTLLVIDGFEQPGWLARRRVKRHCRRHGAGLLVTAHRPTGLPALYRTAVTGATAEAVVRGLIPAGGGWVLEGYDVAARLRAHRGSLREVLFEVYDRWERKRV